jgi:SAM-dependent methyltransferase
MTSPIQAFLYQYCRCPDCRDDRGVPLTFSPADVRCTQCGACFPRVEGIPVLVRHDNAVFPLSAYTRRGGTPPVASRTRRGLPVPSASVNLSSQRMTERLGQETVSRFGEGTVLVVGGGRQREWLDQRFAPWPQIRLLYSDIDINSDIDLFCDGHELPLADASVQGVITTAVLEHVLYPERVAAEIHRVLAPGGLLYSEVPFMQQVHEGAYDFTRYTLSGHRRLFNGFDELDSGMVAGPGTALLWSLENLALCYARGSTSRSLTKAGVRTLWGWLKWLDAPLKDHPQALDSASCTYFLGTRRASGIVPDSQIIERYRGAKHVEHL